jgi:hypothetical protein
MDAIRAYNAAAATNLADYAARAHCWLRDSRERVTATRKAIDLSQALIASIDTFVAKLTSELTRKGCLWPAYLSAPSEPEMEADWRDSPRRAVAQWRGSAQEVLARAETMRDPDARRMMRELAMHYETLAARVENAVLRQDNPPQDDDKFLPERSGHARAGPACV